MEVIITRFQELIQETKLFKEAETKRLQK